MSSNRAAMSLRLMPEDRRVEEHVVAARELGVEAGAELEQGRHALVHAHAAGVRLQDAGHALQQRRLARAVLADDAEDLAFLHVEGDVVEGGELVVAGSALAGDQLP